MSDTARILTNGEAQTREAGRLLGELTLADDVVALVGGLGAGKTALVQGIAEGLGVIGPVPSPTFNILLVHPGERVLYHFDLYRLERPRQLEDIDFYETLESGGVTAIEWADRFPGELPADHLAVRIERLDETSRSFSPSGSGPRSEALARHWADAWTRRTDAR